MNFQTEHAPTATLFAMVVSEAVAISAPGVPAVPSCSMASASLPAPQDIWPIMVVASCVPSTVRSAPTLLNAFSA